MIEQKKTCKTTITDEEYFLNDRIPHGSAVGLRNVYSEEQLKQRIPMRDVKWEEKEGDYIEVWYELKNEKWILVDSYKYDRSTKF
ncbi:hypothetical protein [Cochleicola gelatinilyticus]|uniref:Uncharacterized protein n=1 Tax=Cochleicola gelatinilyticus TaxID=1763537 RepID=A0A167HLI7_9FLAO|nr:hypothetical protein [Cochleicola gelatinilyticus]OAB78740.1 hypothetical protein ULVI_09160 [Cochleicola gelatinilyticus]